MTKPISKRITIKDSNDVEAFLKVSKALDLFAKRLDKGGPPVAVLISDDPSVARTGPQNALLQCYYTEINKSEWAKGQGQSKIDTIVYCKRNIIIQVLKEQATVMSLAGFLAIEKVSAVTEMMRLNYPEEYRVDYLRTEGWSSILDVDHFRKYLIAIELHFIDKLNYRLESINTELRNEALLK